MTITRYYKNLNTTGKVKSGIILIGCLLNLIIPVNTKSQHGSPVFIIMPLIFGCIIIPLIVRVNSVIFTLEIRKPMWTENPLNFRRPLILFDFFASLFVAVGLSILIGTAIKYQLINEMALSCMCYGFGIFIGIFLSLRWMGNK
jgi:hypothetical protein